ncbi:unnamed protein product, partial [Prorocentrum cordatum]
VIPKYSKGGQNGNYLAFIPGPPSSAATACFPTAAHKQALLVTTDPGTKAVLTAHVHKLKTDDGITSEMATTPEKSVRSCTKGQALFSVSWDEEFFMGLDTVEVSDTEKANLKRIEADLRSVRDSAGNGSSEAQEWLSKCQDTQGAIMQCAAKKRKGNDGSTAAGASGSAADGGGSGSDPRGEEAQPTTGNASSSAAAGPAA